MTLNFNGQNLAWTHHCANVFFSVFRRSMKLQRFVAFRFAPFFISCLVNTKQILEYNQDLILMFWHFIRRFGKCRSFKFEYRILLHININFDLFITATKVNDIETGRSRVEESPHFYRFRLLSCPLWLSRNQNKHFL